jgi:hypothetical protein
MPTPEEFLEATKYFGLATLTMAGITLIAFLLKWGFRFRLVGITSFIGVLTAGMFGLSFEPFTRTVVPGSVPYQTVYDSGAAQIVIKVPDDITKTELAATLEEAASNLFKASRLGGASLQPTIRARTILHPEDGTSQLVYLGQAQPTTAPQTDKTAAITLFDDAFAQLPTPQTLDNDA